MLALLLSTALLDVSNVQRMLTTVRVLLASSTSQSLLLSTCLLPNFDTLHRVTSCTG